MYQKINIVKAQQNFSSVFNEVLNQHKDEIYCFLTTYVDFVPNIEYNGILNIFNNFQDVQCVYTDNNTFQDRLTNTIYYPAFNYQVCNRLTINTPIFCKGTVKPRFKNLQYMIYADFIKEMSNHMLWHYPAILFNVTVNKEELLKELQNEQSN